MPAPSPPIAKLHATARARLYAKTGAARFFFSRQFVLLQILVGFARLKASLSRETDEDLQRFQESRLRFVGCTGVGALARRVGTCARLFTLGPRSPVALAHARPPRWGVCARLWTVAAHPFVSLTDERHCAKICAIPTFRT